MAGDAYSESGRDPSDVRSILPASPADFDAARARFPAWSLLGPSSDVPYPTAFLAGIGRAYDRLWGHDLGELVAKVAAIDDALARMDPE